MQNLSCDSFILYTFVPGRTSPFYVFFFVLFLSCGCWSFTMKNLGSACGLLVDILLVKSLNLGNRAKESIIEHLDIGFVTKH